MALNRRSRLITHGVARSPNRAMPRAVGFGDGDFEKPVVGVANGHSMMKKWKQPEPRYTRGALAQFAAQASSASVCAVTD